MSSSGRYKTQRKLLIFELIVVIAIILIIGSPIAGLPSSYGQNPIGESSLLLSSLIGNFDYASLDISTENQINTIAHAILPSVSANSDSTTSNVTNNYQVTGAGISVGSLPVGIAVNSITNKIYVTNEYSNTVSVINGNNDKVEGNISVGALPYDLDIDPFTNRIYVGNVGSDTISVIDGTTNKVVANIERIETPVGLDFDSATSYIYVTSIDTNKIFKIDAVTNKVLNNITVGKNPYTVDIKPARENSREYKIYVSNLGSNTVSVIDGNSFTLIKNIAVGELPVGLAANANNNKVYVANRGSDTVSIIDAVSDTVVKNLTVGDDPDGIDINFSTNMVYVTNTGSSTVSVIGNKTNDVVEEIIINSNYDPGLLEALGEDLPPTVQFPNLAGFVDVNPVTNMVYVTNMGSNIVSVIDGNTNRLAVGFTFSITPSNSGQLECVDTQNDNNKFNITNQYVRIAYLTQLECSAHPYLSYTFSSWSHVSSSSSSLINSNEKSPTPSNFLPDLFGLQSDKIKFNIMGYGGNLTANFIQPTQVSIPTEFWITLYGVIVSSIIGWSIPGIVGWIKVRRHQKRLRYYHNRIQCLYDDGKLDQNDIDSLDALKIEIVDAYTKGKITDLYYTNLKNEISLLYEEIYKKKIDSLNSSISDKNNSKFLDKIKSDISDAYAQEKINEVHYNLLNEKIAKISTDNALKGKVNI